MLLTNIYQTALTLTCVVIRMSPALATTTVIPLNSFNNLTTFESYWVRISSYIKDRSEHEAYETDIGEWKGTANNWFNTFNTSSVVKSTLVPWPTDLSFHALKAIITAEPNNVDVNIDFYLDNVFRVTQYGAGFVGKPLWLQVSNFLEHFLFDTSCLQHHQSPGWEMEGSSGSPGPTGTTTYKVGPQLSSDAKWLLKEMNTAITLAQQLVAIRLIGDNNNLTWYHEFFILEVVHCRYMNLRLHVSLLVVLLAYLPFNLVIGAASHNSSTQLNIFPTPSVLAGLEVEDDIMPLRSSPSIASVTSESPTSSTFRAPPQQPLDVQGYPLPHGLSLEQVHVYVRHGERTPVGVRLAPFIPEHWVMCKTRRQFRESDSTVSEAIPSKRAVEKKDGSSSEGLCLLGELSDIGRQSTYDFGAALRRLYIERLQFLPDTLRKPSETYFRSTNMPRTIESLEQIIHGLYPTNKCSPDVLPTLLVRNGRDENLLGNTLSCKRLEYLQIGFAQAAAAAYNQTLEPLDEKISKYLEGRPIRVDGKPRASGVLDTVRAAIAHGVKVPSEFEDKSVIDVIEQAVVNEWFAGQTSLYAVFRRLIFLGYKTQEVRRLGMGPLLSDLSQKLQQKVDRPNDLPKLLVHSTHDTALAAMCNTLDVFDDKWPAFTASITFELFKKAPPEDDQSSYLQTILSPFKTTSALPEYFVRMRYQNKNMALPACAEEGKHLAGSPELCTLTAFRARVKELTPVDWERECGSTGWM
ncbi:Acid phosphatase [Mycena indigotica]|uniref:Acid phosphatase n=1 Tax=Mycena indigotica TaxID=2126181 RepID=A0A8H6S246_9AGAR|nr:Acid phosphatase [Mycena indigotica]KAF7289915.1 Acid phosphatase [Mycena indigotica]